MTQWSTLLNSRDSPDAFHGLTLPTPTCLLAGRTLGIEWPPDYALVISEHNGVEGSIGEWLLLLTPVEELVERNTDPVMDFSSGLVVIGGDGGGEAIAIDRATHEILLVPWIGGDEDWLVLGATLTEAFQRMERGGVLDAPHRTRPDAASGG